MARTLKPEAITAIVDTREKHPLDLAPLRTRLGTLATGDYSVAGLEQVIAIERKALPDLLACVGRERERFDREVKRLLAFPVRLLLVEASWGAIELGQWRGKLTPAHVSGSLLGWTARGLPVCLAGNHDRAGRIAARLLFLAARHRWREAEAFCHAAGP